MINVLHVIGYIGCGGDTMVVLNAMKGLNNSDIHFDFLTHYGAKDDTVDFLRSNGSKVYIMDGDVRKLGIIKYYKKTLAILKNSETKYDAIHVHTGMQSGVVLRAAKAAGISSRICHSHITAIQRKSSFLKRALAIPLFRFLYMTNSTQKVACSEEAGKFLFGSKTDFTVIYNAIDIEPYISITAEETRKLRTELGFSESDIVIGHVARMSPMKNQRYILKIAERVKNNKNIKFVLVGDGKDFDEIKKLAEPLPNVILLGRRCDIPALMKAFDCFLFPSLRGEGLPVAIVEAQAAGCQCIASTLITKEVEAGLNQVTRIPLDDVDLWIDAILKTERNLDYEYRNKCAQLLIEYGFGNDEFVKKWEKCYNKA